MSQLMPAVASTPRHLLRSFNLIQNNKDVMLCRARVSVEITANQINTEYLNVCSNQTRCHTHTHTQTFIRQSNIELWSSG